MYRPPLLHYRDGSTFTVATRNDQWMRVLHSARQGLRVFRVLAIACISFIVLIGVALSLLMWSCEPPSVSTLADQFPTARTDLELLLAMAQQDSNLVRIDPAWLMTRDFSQFTAATPETGISPERWERYRQLFKRNHITQGIRRNPETGDAFVIVQSTGLLNRGSSDGYLHCGPGPEHAYLPCAASQASGAHSHGAAGDEAYSFIRLAGGWYAYSEGPS